MRPTLVRVTRTLVLSGGAVLVLAVVAGPPVFSTVFGQDFGAGGELLLALGPLYFSMLVAAPAGMTLVALDRRRLQAAFTGARLAGAVVSIGLAHAAGLSLTWAVAAYAAAMAIVSGGLGALAWRLSGQADARRSADDARG
jgi:O-antigen/teichoic acid export membrane protein